MKFKYKIFVGKDMVFSTFTKSKAKKMANILDKSSWSEKVYTNF